MDPIEIRIPADTRIDHATLYELECFGRFSKFRLTRCRVLLVHAYALRDASAPDAIPSSIEQDLPSTLQGAPAEYVVGPYSTFEYSPVQ